MEKKASNVIKEVKHEEKYERKLKKAGEKYKKSLTSKTPEEAAKHKAKSDKNFEKAWKHLDKAAKYTGQRLRSSD